MRERRRNGSGVVSPVPRSARLRLIDARQLLACTVLAGALWWGILGAKVAQAETPLTIGNYTTLSCATNATCEVSSSLAAIVNVDVESKTTAITSAFLEVTEPGGAGVTVSSLTYTPKAAGEVRDMATVLVGPKGTVKVGQTSGEIAPLVRYATVKGGEGPAGTEGKEGKEGKEGPAGTEGKAGSTFTGSEAHEISDETILYVLGGMAGLMVCWCVWQVVKP